jgi:hypothetical protein
MKNPKNFTFIHIGKCGGSTIRSLLRENNLNFKCVHTTPKTVRSPSHPSPLLKTEYNSDTKYLIVLRNPVERFVSAFYWRKFRVSTIPRQRHRYAGEYDFFQKYTTVEDLIQDGITALQRQYVHHIKQDIHYFLGDFVDQCNPSNVIGVICTENLNKDIKNIFHIKVQSRKNDNSKRKTTLREGDRKFLKKYLYKDYLVIEKLNNLSLLSKKQYKILSK